MTRRKRQPKKETHLPVETHGYKKYKHDKRKEEPFLVTNLKVAGALVIAFAAIYGLYNIKSFIPGSSTSMRDSEGVWSQYVNDDAANAGAGEGENEEDAKSKEFPRFDLGPTTKYDAWGIAEEFLSVPGNSKYAAFIASADRIREDFAERWGGENAARAVLEKGLSTFAPTSTVSSTDIPEGIRYTASRIFNAQKSGKPFKISFAGAAAVSGRGNYFAESFPSVLAGVLVEPFQQMGIELEVRNGAIAGISSFPYGWCLNNFLGDDADVVSWDPEMTNRGDTNAAFEAYLRNAITMKHSPMLVVREYAYTESRRELLQKYVDLGAMSDPVVINVEAAVAPFKDLDESILPLGYEQWLDFGGPDSAPGKTRTNLSLKQHELVGEMLSMYFLAAAELALAHRLKATPSDIFDVGPTSKPHYKHFLLPLPQTSDLEYDGVSRNMTMMFGSPVPADQHWYMNDVHCRTSFDPVLSGGLDEIILHGSSAEDIDLLRPRGPMLYNQHWVLDYGPVAKNLASSAVQYNFGYQDRRKGYFGVQPSKNLTMFLPYQLNDSITKYKQLEKKKPSEVYKSVIVCEVNERANCKMASDVTYMLGGEGVKAKVVEANGASYNGRKLCVSLSIPEDAAWFTRKEIKEGGGLLRHKTTQEETGLILDISVSNNLLFWKEGPCSVSHVIWEQVRAL